MCACVTAFYVYVAHRNRSTHTHVTTLPGREPFVIKLVYVHALCSRLPDVVVAPGRACLTLRMSYKKFLFLYVVYACLAKTHPRTYSHTHACPCCLLELERTRSKTGPRFWSQTGATCRLQRRAGKKGKSNEKIKAKSNGLTA